MSPLPPYGGKEVEMPGEREGSGLGQAKMGWGPQGEFGVGEGK